MPRTRFRAAALTFAALLAAAGASLSCEGDTVGEGPMPDSVAISPASFEIFSGGTQQLSAAVLDADGVAFAGPTVKWSSEDELIATVSARGLVLGTMPGATRIKATSMTAEGFAAVKVIPTPAMVLEPGSVTFDATAGGADPTPQTVRVTNSGSGSILGLSVGATTYTGAAGWVGASVTNDSTIVIRAFIAGLAQGVHSASVAIGSTNASNSPQLLNVSVVVNP